MHIAHTQRAKEKPADRHACGEADESSSESQASKVTGRDFGRKMTSMERKTRLTMYEQ